MFVNSVQFYRLGGKQKRRTASVFSTSFLSSSWIIVESHFLLWKAYQRYQHLQNPSECFKQISIHIKTSVQLAQSTILQSRFEGQGFIIGKVHSDCTSSSNILTSATNHFYSGISPQDLSPINTPCQFSAGPAVSFLLDANLFVLLISAHCVHYLGIWFQHKSIFLHP